MTRGNPVGLGIALAGAATIILGLFLPFNEPTGPFARIQDNTLIESDGWILLLLAITVAAGATRAWMKPDGLLWLLPLITTVVMGGWIAIIAANEDMRTLYPIVNGTPNANAPGVVADLGIAVYVAGAGIVAVIAGSMILKFYPTTQTGPVELPTQQGQRRKCPDCAELIMVDAKVCKHCGYRFASRAPVEAAPAARPVKVIVNCPLCEAEQRIPKGAPRFRCGQCRETVDAP